MAFRAIFAIFRMWVPRVTRERFVLVREGDEHKFFEPSPVRRATITAQRMRHA